LHYIKNFFLPSNSLESSVSASSSTPPLGVSPPILGLAKEESVVRPYLRSPIPAGGPICRAVRFLAQPPLEAAGDPIVLAVAVEEATEFLPAKNKF
jgi:hypothetical protein